MAIFNKITIKFNFKQEDWELGCSFSFSFLFIQIPYFPKILSLKSWWFTYGVSVFLNCAIFPVFFACDCLKNFLFEILGLLSPKLGTNHFTMTKDSICWCFGLCFCLNQVKPHFLPNSNHSKPCFRKMQF